MKVYPLQSITLKEAEEKQFRLVDCVMHYFTGSELLTRGDLGVHQPENEPLTTMKAERAIAEFFNAETAILVRGSGTGAIRYALAGAVKAGSKILIHQAPAYSTTQTSIDMFGLEPVRADYNDLDELVRTLQDNDVDAALVQYSRQNIADRYDISEVIRTIKETSNIPIIVDDNYAVMKVSKIGSELGADLSCFSTFKLQGPEGIGCIVGKKQYIDRIRKMHYSGGCQTQGWEALEVLRGLIYAPVLLAIQAETIEDVLRRINEGEVSGIKEAFIANAQSKVLLVSFDKPIARKVLKAAEKRGALPNPVGSESKYEITPLFYKVSGTFLKSDPTLIDYMIRVNPNRAGSDTVIRILRESIAEAERGDRNE
ncbi:MAG: aminotransferase class V-fold PLP-dependent enzyme [Erysipelotrichaceae bacterium]|nr:aminotransferase class V-fold PLP-dependent enzyme [Erysipelotrichaceae bacterium]